MHYFDVLLVWILSMGVSLPLISISVTFLYLLLSFSSLVGFFFPPPVLQSTFPEQPQEPSYIKLQHKDDVRIMNPHLHRHLYSDLPGYKLGRSSRILSSGFHGKLRLWQLLSGFSWLLSMHVSALCVSVPVCVCVHVCMCVHTCSCRWSLMTTCFLRRTLPSFSFSAWCHFMQNEAGMHQQ